MSVLVFMTCFTTEGQLDAQGLDFHLGTCWHLELCYHWCPADLGDPRFQLRPQWHLGLVCCQRSCLVPWSFWIWSLGWCPQGVVIKGAKVAQDLGCHLWPCWCLRILALPGPYRPECQALTSGAMASYMTELWLGPYRWVHGPVPGSICMLSKVPVDIQVCVDAQDMFCHLGSSWNLRGMVPLGPGWS